uniref:Unannotated protein n=1 Tax=freshwater metagenome TaxID=449393 RepID=A0A6J5ZGF6_9ZZZZ
MIANAISLRTEVMTTKASTQNARPDTTKLARALILIAAGLSMALSVGIWFLADDKLAGIFVGTWVPSILALGTLILPRPER